MSPNEAKVPSVSKTTADNHQDKKNGTKKMEAPKKVYVHRESILTDLMELSHVHTLHNIAVAVCILLFINSIILYLAEPSKLWDDLGVMKWGAGKFWYFLMFWLMYHVLAFAFYEGFKLWIVVRNTINSKIADGLFLLLYVVSLCLTLTYSAAIIFNVGFRPISGFATGCEQVRIYMKIHSFVRENTPRVLQYRPKKDGSQEHALYPTRKHYLYYLFAPALIYRDSYPMTEKRNWGKVLRNLCEFFMVIFITYCVFMRFNKDLFRNVGLQPFTRKEAALLLAGSTVAGSIMMFMMFYSILHCWLNFAAELCRFGDKGFYQEWWNSTSFTQYYRRWNIVVHDWLHAYIYTDTQKLGCNRSFSLFLVFLISAAFHEYIISIAFGYFYPVLLVVYSTIGISVVFLTKQKTTQYWNIFLWSALFSGWGTIVIFYTMEWYARINCPKQETSLDFYKPRSWDPSCDILDFY